MNQEKLVSAKEMAEILGVKISWIYERSRQGTKAIPMLKVGKYVRFSPGEVLEYFRKEEKR